MYESILQQIGLTASETKVYMALLDLGEARRADIVARAGIAGSKVYDLLAGLQEKGLVSIHLEHNIKHFRPTHPKQILHYLEEKKDHILEVEQQVRTILPRLLTRFQSSFEEQEVELLNGIKGLEALFREQVELLQPGDTCYVIGGTKGTEEEVVVAFFQKIHALREEKKIKTKMLYNLRQKETTERWYSHKKYPGTIVRYISHTSPVAINIYKDRTVIIIFGTTITAIHIKSQETAQSFLEYFNLLWNQR